MNRAFKLDKEDEKALKAIKKERRTRNSSQIFREALWHYYDFLFKQITHTSVTESTEANA